ncbi:hypothetical protein C1645_46399 [Glomus cerebriforme]|uniref:Uncharacterized protein n=1 Tax=Glomus cerebriforme TaxID=658196 RepID=A0A397T303_9GLOM|nr:hypothetical protein C1645_46399 [Glomus cerebriforme]
MRELLLVRKLQEENAKKNKPIENISSENSDKGHDAADSKTNITKNISDNANQTFNREVHVKNTKSHDIDDNVKISIPDDKINPTHQSDASNVDKISEQVINDNNCNQSTGETSFNENTEKSQSLQPVEENTLVISKHDINDLIDPMSNEEKKHNEAVSLALQTKRESLKEFFLQKQPYIHKDTFTDNQIVLDSNFIDDKKLVSLTNIKDESIIEEQLTDEIPSQESETIKPKDTIITDKPLTSPPANLELSPDEKRQKAAAARNMQRKDLKQFLKQKKQAMERKSDETADIIIMEPEKAKESLETKNFEVDIINSKENSILNNGLNGDDKVQLETKNKGERNNSIHLKRSKNKSSSVDTDSDGSVDLDALIAEGSDLESGEIQLNDDGLDDGDDNFWRVDPAEV